MVFMSLMGPSKHQLADRDVKTSTATPSAVGAAPQGTVPTEAPEDPAISEDQVAPLHRVKASLYHASTAAAEQGMSLEEFMQLAWSMYVDARPGLREHLAEVTLAQQLQDLRAQGRIGQA